MVEFHRGKPKMVIVSGTSVQRVSFPPATMPVRSGSYASVAPPFRVSVSFRHGNMLRAPNSGRQAASSDTRRPVGSQQKPSVQRISFPPAAVSAFEQATATLLWRPPLRRERAQRHGKHYGCRQTASSKRRPIGGRPNGQQRQQFQ